MVSGSKCKLKEAWALPGSVPGTVLERLDLTRKLLRWDGALPVGRAREGASFAVAEGENKRGMLLTCSPSCQQ